jgi:hypothetical protein
MIHLSVNNQDFFEIWEKIVCEGDHKKKLLSGADLTLGNSTLETTRK